MLAFCRGLCKDDKKHKKKDKKDKHGKPDEKHKNKVKNVYAYSLTGQGKKNVEQDTYAIFEITDENTVVKFYGVFDGHGDFGKEVKLSLNMYVGFSIG